MGINLDEPFDKSIYEKILPQVADVFCQLAAKLSLCKMSENAIDELLQKKANLMKCAITHYIDSQAEILKDSLREYKVGHNRSSNLIDDRK